MQNPSPNDRQEPHEKLRLVLGRPLRRPGETREQAAERLASEMFGALREERQPKPEEHESGPPTGG
jgi:hypothetical protein